MSANLPLGSKIRFEQIEDGYLILDFIRKFERYDTEIRELAESQNATISDLKNKVTTLEETVRTSLSEFESSYKEEINNKVGDFQTAITELRNYCDEKFYDKNKNIGLADFDNETTLLLDAILNTIENLQVSLNNIIYDYDKDGNYRKILWRVYFEVSTEHVIYLKDIDGFKEDMTRYITLEDFYGKEYASKNYSNPSIEVFCFGPTHSFITEYEAMARDYLDRAIMNVERENKPSTFVPRTNIEDNVLYPEHPILGSVSYDTRSRSFDFKNVATTNYLLKVVKFID